MKTLYLFSAVMALAAVGLASTALAQGDTQYGTVTATIKFDSNTPLTGDRPESTSILNYLASFKDFSDSNASQGSILDVMSFIASDGDTSSLSNNSSSRILQTSTTLETIEPTDLFALLFRTLSTGQRDHGTSFRVLSHDNTTFVRGTSGLERDDEANPLLNYIGRALQTDASSEAGDIKLKDARYTLD